MRKTAKVNTDQRISVDINTLATMLDCGLQTARKIGEDAEDRIVIGKRVLYNVQKIQKYLDELAC